MNQNEHIHAMLKRGPVTGLQALAEAGCWRLPARVHELRQQGVPVKKRTVKVPSGKAVAEYYL